MNNHKLNLKIINYFRPEDYIRILKYTKEEARQIWIQNFQEYYPEEYTLWKMKNG